MILRQEGRIRRNSARDNITEYENNTNQIIPIIIDNDGLDTAEGWGKVFICMGITALA